MFINCPNCAALVATNLATDLPPERCPTCAFVLLAKPDTAADDGPAATAAVPAFVAPPLTSAPPPAAVAGRAAPRFVPLTPARGRADPATGQDGDEPDAVISRTALEPAAPVPPIASRPASADPVTPAGAGNGAQDDFGDAPAEAPAPGSPAPRTDDAPSSVSPEAALMDPAPDPALEPDAAVATGAAAVRTTPGFIQPRAPAAALDWRLLATAAGLVLLLVAQLLVAERARLAGHAAWRPVVASLCAVLRCQLPAWREPDAISVQQRDVRPSKGRPGVLQVSAVIRNDAARPQAWPRITLTLSDVDGRALGMRTFEPAEYLLQPPAHTTLASGEAVAIGLEVVEPSPHAVAFNFRFH